MTVTAPPRPPRPSDPFEREELEALVEALIKEARERARRRRRVYAAVVTLVALAGATVFVVLERTAWSQSASPALKARPALSAGVAKQRIAFVSYRGGGPANHGTVYVVNADGSGQRRLARAVWDFPPAWSPDGRRLAFVRGIGANPEVANSEIYVVNADGSGERRLTRNPAHDLSPAWSPDGQKIAFVRGDPNELYVMNADGSGERRLARNAGPAAWSPDGRKIAFVGNGPAGSDVYLMNADGGSQRNLTRNAAYEDSLAWSPDGRRIAFVKHTGCLRCSPNSELWVMTVGGSGKRVVAFGEGIGVPSWSPDGETLVYESSYRPNPNDPKRRFMHVTELFRVNADGSGRRRLTYGARPLWSPDGQGIAFLRSGRLVGGLYVMNADGSAQRRLAPNARGGATWSPGRSTQRHDPN